MVEEVAHSLYRIPIPLPGSLLGSVNAYVIKGRERNLIIGPGMNLDPCMETMDEGLRRIGIDAATSDFFITHSHPDHFPLVSRLMGEGSVIYIDRREAEVLERREIGRNVCQFSELRKADRIPGQRHEGNPPP